MFRKISFFLNSCRLILLKAQKEYFGKVFCRIPFGLQIKVNRSGKLMIAPGILIRSPGYISVSKGALSIGSNCFFNTNTYIVCRKSISIGNDCLIGPNVCIVDHDHDYHAADRSNSFLTDSVSIGNNVWIGANSVILRGTQIGDNCVIGAGTVVSGKYEANSIIKSERVLNTRMLHINEIL